MRRERKPEGRGGMLYTTLMCGVPLLLVGILAAGVSLFDPPPDNSERWAAASVAVMGLVFGPGFISMALPERWGVPGRLWRWCGWMVAAAPLPFAILLLSDPERAARDTRQIGSGLGAVLTALGLITASAFIARAWLRSVRSGGR